MQPEVIKQLDFIIKVNQRVAESVGHVYLVYLRTIFTDLLRIYGLYSQCISNSINVKQNENMLKPMKTVRRDILRLIQTFIEKAQEYSVFNQEFLPTLKTLADDFQLSDPNARDPEVLMLFATMFKKMGELLIGYLSSIINNLCHTTLQMIKNDYLTFPEFRESFFTLIEKIIKHCTAGLFSLGLSEIETFIHTVLFAIKHEKPELMDIGLNTLHALNMLVSSEQGVVTAFYKTFYTTIIRDTIAVMTDYRHMAGFKLQGLIL